MRLLSILVCCVLAQPYVFSQTVAQPAAGSGESGLSLVVVRGEGAINNIRKRSANEAAVQLKDGAGKPVAGAAVSFILPTQGASGEFSNGSQSITIPTDTTGTAAVRIKPNGVSGRLEIRVNASHRGETARTVIAQNNLVVPGAGGGSGKVIAILAILGGAAAGGIVAFTQSGGSSVTPAPTPTPPVPIAITPGTGTAGPPF